MRLALDLASRSTCARLKVGCVITTEDFQQVLSIGYNGNAAGMPNACDSEVPGACGCIHDVANAIIKCHAPNYVHKIIFATHSPCKMCAKMIINLGGVKAVYYRELYRSSEGLRVLTMGAVHHQKHEPVAGIKSP